MSKGAVNMNENNVEYYTPKSIVDYFGRFDYDPATTPAKAADLGIPNYDTIETDGLKSDWTKYRNIWINPPFNRKDEFWDKACKTYAKVRNHICFLCPTAFLTTRRFHNSLVANGIAATIYLPNSRIKFQSGIGMDGKSPAFGSIIVVPSDTCALRLVDFESENKLVA